MTSTLPKLAALGAILLSLGAALLFGAQSPYPQTLPANSVVGRIGTAGVAGPAQAIPFTTLLAQLSSLPTVITGPATTTSGHITTWNSSNGTALADSGVAITGAGSIGFGTSGSIALTGSGAITVATGETLTDTSGATSGDILLSNGTGGFSAYGGVTCSTGSLTALSASGAKTCSAAKAATQTNVSAPAGPNSTSVVKMQGLAGSITPAVTGNVLITISGTIVESGDTTAGDGISYQISYGTGGAPSTNGTLAGTQAAMGTQVFTVFNTAVAADVSQPFSVSFLVTGLTVGTAYWIDLAAEAVGQTGFSFSHVSVSAAEI